MNSNELHILHSADVRAGHSSFSYGGVSAKSMAVPRRTTEEQSPGHQFCVAPFCTEAAAATVVAAVALRLRLGMRARTSFDPRGPPA